MRNPFTNARELRNIKNGEYFVTKFCRALLLYQKIGATHAQCLLCVSEGQIFLGDNKEIRLSIECSMERLVTKKRFLAFADATVKDQQLKNALIQHVRSNNISAFIARCNSEKADSSNDVSMGAHVYSECENVAKVEDDYCDHIRTTKGVL